MVENISTDHGGWTLTTFGSDGRDMVGWREYRVSLLKNSLFKLQK